jgi:uncharacterized protein (TIGR02001 family)
LSFSARPGSVCVDQAAEKRPLTDVEMTTMSSWGLTKILGLAALGTTLVTGAEAADLAARKKVLPPVVEAAPAPVLIDFAFGAKVLTDYNFRGISQSDREPAVQGYGELQFLDNLFYTGIFASTVDLPTRPDAEVDLTFGVRPKLGPFTFDIGGIYYWYPGERQLIDPVLGAVTPRDTDFFEFAAKASYSWQDTVTLGANVFHAWDWLGTGAEATYVSGTVKVNTPFLAGGYVSGELGHYFIGTATDPGPAFNVPDYTYWNIGAGYTYKNLTVDLRYHDTDATRAECFAITADPRGFANGGRSRWCDATFIASASVDLVASQLGVFAPR